MFIYVTLTRKSTEKSIKYFCHNRILDSDCRHRDKSSLIMDIIKRINMVEVKHWINLYSVLKWVVEMLQFFLQDLQDLV